MVKKKVTKKKAKRVVRRKTPVRKANQKIKSARRVKSIIRPVRSTERKRRLVVNNLIFFVILAVISYILKVAASVEIYVNLFAILSMIFFFVALAFLVIYLALFFLKLMKK
jgi:Flp pilus assembly protein TadB